MESAANEFEPKRNSTTRVHGICSETDDLEETPIKQWNSINISVGVESLENIDMCSIKEIMIKITFGDEIVSQSDRIAVTSNAVDIELVGNIINENDSFKFINNILSTPILITVYSYAQHATNTLSTPKAEKEHKKKTSKATTSRTSVPQTNNTPSVVGICNLDISNLLLGQNTVKEILLVEPEKDVLLKDSVSWVKLPKIRAFASIEDNQLVFETLNDSYNIVGITVESVYNLPENFAEGTLFDTIIPVPCFGDKNNHIIFSNGKVTLHENIDPRKKWLNLLHLQGNGGKSKFRVYESSCDIISPLASEVDLDAEMAKRSHKVEWNTWTRCLINKSDSNYYYSQLTKNHGWPIKIALSTKTSAQKFGKLDKKSKPMPPEPASHETFTAILNFSALLYPGVSKVRAAAQLFSDPQLNSADKVGADSNATHSEVSKNKPDAQKLLREIEEPKEQNSGLPVTQKDGSPTFIIVEIELWKPFSRQKTHENLEKELKSYLCVKGDIPKKSVNFELARDSFLTSIQDIISAMIQEYTNFINNNKINKATSKDTNFTFYEFLRCQETYSKLSACLETKVMSFIHEKFGKLHHYDERFPEIYVALIEEMHKLTNKFILSANNTLSAHFNTNFLQLFAEEAMEEEDFELAKNYILLNISKNKTDPDYWLDYAVYCIRLNDYYLALEAIREALALDVYHQIGLLLYGVLMGKLGDASAAEVTFQFLLTKYPKYSEGWKIFHFFYTTIQNLEGGDVTLQTSMKLEYEKKLTIKKSPKKSPYETVGDAFNCKHFTSPENYSPNGDSKYGVNTFVQGMSWSEPLSWSVSFCPPDNINVRTTILLLKLGLLEFASMALAKELVAKDCLKCPYYAYYLSVIYYLQGFYNEAISNLEVAVKDYGKDCSLWSLMGHCYYKLEDYENAIACYEYVMESFNRPDNLHLIYLRMGYYYLKINKLPCAKKVFVTSCKYSSSPRLWKGVGLACIKLKEYEEAELAFSEANYLDNSDAETWGYLALVNGLLRRVDMSKNCFLEAKKRALKNKDLIDEIKICFELNNMDFED